MPHTDPVILALMALGEPAGAAPDNAHAAECADCQLELERLTRLVELARRGGPALIEQPPASVWDRIAAATGEGLVPANTVSANTAPADAPPPGLSQPTAPVTPATPAARATANGSGTPAGQPRTSPDASGPPRRTARRRRPRLVTAVAGLVAGIVIGIGATVAVTQLTRPAESPVVAEIELRPLPQFPQWEGAAGTAVLRQGTAARQLALTVTVTAPQRTGFYEVWLLGKDGTSMISLGDLNAANTGTFTLPAGANLSFYSRIDVSLQPFDGSTLHSSTSVVRGPLPAKADSAANRA